MLLNYPALMVSILKVQRNQRYNFLRLCHENKKQKDLRMASYQELEISIVKSFLFKFTRF